LDVFVDPTGPATEAEAAEAGLEKGAMATRTTKNTMANSGSISSYLPL
jgi:hypothetical protein